VLEGNLYFSELQIQINICIIRNPKHESEMADNGIKPIDLVVMNLYAFEATVASGAEFEKCIENIDIGGPSMLRSSAKNHAYVNIITSPNQYGVLMDEMKESNGCTCLASRKKFAAQAFALSASYESAIAGYFASQLGESAPVMTKAYEPATILKYGCNPHQKPAAIYKPIGKNLPFTIVNGTPGDLSRMPHFSDKSCLTGIVIRIYQYP
jgi:phosphoribosylaminoimidazolecarboxamide formyltransferase/IMP cyclohydrolase